MRNLKKILALVLALVMSMSLLATANAFEDDKDIDPTFDEAITVLSNLGVFQGYNEGATFGAKMDEAAVKLTVEKSPDKATVEMDTEDEQTFSVDVTITQGNDDVTRDYDIEYDWYLDGKHYDTGSTCELSELELDDYVLTCAIVAEHETDDDAEKLRESVSWNIEVVEEQDIELSIAEAETYYFNDDDTVEGESVYDLIDEAMDYEDYDSVSFSATSGTTVAALKYDSTDKEYYLDIKAAGTWFGKYSVKENNREVLSGDITIEIVENAGINIIYTAEIGEEVDLNIEDFEDFWSEATNGRGDLESVTFDSVTGVAGDLWYTGGSKDLNAERKTFYTDPARYQNPLEDLTFKPTKRSGGKYPTGSVTISFTAEGTNKYDRDTEASGSIIILYTDGEVEAINYSATGSYIELDGKDFDVVYKEAMDTTTKNPRYTIKFLELPIYGTLYANASEDRKGNLTGTELTAKNFTTFEFTNSGTTSRSINKVVYQPGYRKTGDLVRYAVYSGGSLKYIGTINFGFTAPEINYSCANGGVTFKAVDFFTGSSMVLTDHVSFGTPTSGTLYKNYANGRGTRVTAADKFGYTTNASIGVQSISNVTFVPNAGFNGLVQIPFTSTTIGGAKIEGVVKINVISRSFTDVPATYWGYSYIMRLVGEGVVSGTTPTTFSPAANVKYGEALKMILLAAGYPEQVEGSGNNWASNYLTLAFNNGIVSSKNVNLNASVDRYTIASITAKALGMKQATRVNAGIKGPSDTTDGYVYALYNAGILDGTTTNGVNRYNGSSKLTRAELSAIVCRVLDYKG